VEVDESAYQDMCVILDELTVVLDVTNQEAEPEEGGGRGILTCSIEIDRH